MEKLRAMMIEVKDAKKKSAAVSLIKDDLSNMSY
jgi:hypothetical protein